MVWVLEAALVVVALLFRKPAVLRYMAVLGIVMLLHTPAMALYNVVALAGIAFSLRRAGAGARLRAAAREPLLLVSAGLLAVLTVSTFLARHALPAHVFASSLRGLVGIAAAGSLALFALLDDGEESRRGWCHALSVGVLALCGIRLLSTFGIDLYPSLRDLLDAEPPGQPVDFGSRNVLGNVLNAALFPLLFVGRKGEARGAEILRYVAAGLAVFVIVSLRSRTAMLVLVISLVVLFLVLLRKQRSALRPVFFVGIVLVAAMALQNRVGVRPIVVENTPAPPGESVGTLQVAMAPSVPHAKKGPRAVRETAGASEGSFSSWDAAQHDDYLFRIPLTKSYHTLEQRVFALRVPETMQLHGRASPECRGRLRVLVNGVLHATIEGPGPFRPDSGWTRFSLPAGIEAGKWHTITLAAEGEVSPANSYYEISALRYASDLVQTRFLVHGHPVAGDVSLDPGLQQGVALILLGDRRALPGGEWLPLKASPRALDQSLRDRVELWKIAWRHALERPIFGWGFYTFGHFFSSLSLGRSFFDDYANADSLYFQFLHDGGLVTILMMIGVFVAAAQTLRRRAPGGLSVEAVALAVSLAGFFLNSVTQVTLSDQRYYGLVSVLLGLYLGDRVREGTASGVSPRVGAGASGK